VLMNKEPKRKTKPAIGSNLGQFILSKCAPGLSEGGSAIYSVIAPLAGLLSILLGLTVIIGWYAGSTLLTQVVPTFAPMQYNTALGFVLGGMSLVALTRDKTTLTRVFGIFPGALGLN